MDSSLHKEDKYIVASNKVQLKASQESKVQSKEVQLAWTSSKSYLWLYHIWHHKLKLSKQAYASNSKALNGHKVRPVTLFG